MCGAKKTHPQHYAPQRIVCAAKRYRKTGRLICGARHWDSVMRLSKLPEESFTGWDQGFIDQFGNFLTREEAWDIAVSAKQISKICYEGQKGYLFSENLCF